MSIEIIGVENFPIIKKDDNLSKIIYETLTSNEISLEENDVLVLAETVVSKAEGNYINLDEITASDEAVQLAEISDKDPRLCQAIIDQSNKILKKRSGLIISETKHGFVCANAGIDNSNCEEGLYTALPDNPDRSARLIKQYLDDKFNSDVAIIISDTQGRAFRSGAVGVAIGVSGICPVSDCRGDIDLYNQELKTTIVGTADELASAASLVMGQSSNGMCLVLIRGYDISSIKRGVDDSSIDEILLDEEKDLFR